MAMKGLLRLAHTVVLFCVIALTGCKTPPPPQPPLANSGSPEIDVLVSYLVQMNQPTKRHKAVVPELTDPFVARRSASYRRDYAAELLSMTTAVVSEDLIRDFCEKNSSTNRILIPGDLTNHVAVLLFSGDELGRLFAGGMGAKPDGWDKFYRKFPGAAGITHFSRVGFNKAGDKAMVYAHTTLHWLAGSGRVFVFEKRDDRWLILPVYWGPQTYN